MESTYHRENALWWVQYDFLGCDISDSRLDDLIEIQLKKILAKFLKSNIYLDSYTIIIYNISKLIPYISNCLKLLIYICRL